MRPGVRNKCLETVRQSPLKLKLERMVIRGGSIGYEISRRKVRIRRIYLHGLEKPSSDGANVGRGYRLLAAQSLLQREIPLKGVRQLQNVDPGQTNSKRVR